MSGRTWRSGPPPHVGWWNASTAAHHSMWRWWNGRQWSWGVLASERSVKAGRNANVPAQADGILWTTYYPENARVPRVNPTP